jgi:predicted RNA binding protein YcfA (HicA-like mRNA interferase family)
MANADIFQRIVDDPYNQSFKKLTPYIKEYLANSFSFDPPGYRKAVNYLSGVSFELGLQKLQGQINEASLVPIKPTWEWGIASQMTRSLFSIQSNIYSVVKAGSRSILPTNNVLPKPCSTNELIKILQKRGFSIVKGGGKGSHVKLKDLKDKTIILPGNRRELSTGILNNTLKVIGLSIYDLNKLI